MSTADCLLDSLNDGSHLLATSDSPNPVALARAVAAVCGADDLPEDPVASELRRQIGEPDHIVYVLADGYGMNFVDRLLESSFSRSNTALALRAVFPTSTGPNLFAQGTGQWPGTHGNLGWYVYLPKLGERVTPFPWQRTRDGESLTNLGVAAGDLYLSAPLARQFKIDAVLMNPSTIALSDSTRALGGVPSQPYESLAEAIDRAIERVNTASSRTFTSIYWPEVDNTAHPLGEHNPRTEAAVQQVDLELARLADGVCGKARVIATADHGHLDVPQDARFRIDPADPLAQMLSAEPGGEARVLYLRVEPGSHDAFADQFDERFGEHFFLVTRDQVEDMRLLGPNPLSAEVRERVGDFVAIARGSASIELCAAGDEGMLLLESTHGGMTPQETLVPLILA